MSHDVGIHGDRDDRDGHDGDVPREQLVHTPVLYNVQVCEYELVCVVQFRLVVGEFLVLSLDMGHVL